MKKWLTFICIIFSSLLSANELTYGTATELNSKTLKETRTHWISLPNGYQDGTKKYPVIYVLDAPVNFSNWVSTARYLSQAGEIPEVILVGTIHQDKFSEFNDPKRFENFKTYLTKELKAHINSNYRTSGFDIITGWSVSATAAMNIGLGSGHWFEGVALFSPAVDPNHLENLNSKSNLQKKQQVFLAKGNETPDFDQGLKALDASLSIKSKDNSISYKFHNLKGASHNHTALASILPAINFQFNQWLPSDEVIASGLNQLLPHYKQAATLYGVSEIVPRDMLIYSTFMKLSQYQSNQEESARMQVSYLLKHYPEAKGELSGMLAMFQQRKHPASELLKSFLEN